MSDDFANPTQRIARALWDRKPSPVSDEEYEHNLYGNRVGVFGKMLGGLGLDASGERKAQPWSKAIMSTLDAPAGLASSIGQAVTAPARAYRGEIAPENMIPEGLNFAGSVALGSAAVPRGRAAPHHLPAPHVAMPALPPENPVMRYLSPRHAEIGMDSYNALALEAPAIRDFNPHDAGIIGLPGMRSASQPTTPLTSDFMGHRRFADRREMDFVPNTESMAPRLGDPGNEHWKWPREPGRIDRALVSDDGSISVGESQKLGRYAAVPDYGNDEFGAAFSPYDRVALDQAWRRKVARTGELFSNPDEAAIPGTVLSSASHLDMSPEARMARAREMGLDTKGYHWTGADFDEFKPHPYRGASFFGRTAEDARRGATAGANDGTGTGSSKLREVMLPGGEIMGLALTPAERRWWSGLPKRAGEGELKSILDQRPNDISYSAKGMPWYQIYDEQRLPDGSFSYTKLPEPRLSWDEASKSKYDVYGDEWPHYNPGSERFSSDHAKQNGMSGYTHQDEAGLAIGMVNPTRIRDVNAAFDPAKSSSANLLAANHETSAAPGLGLMAEDQDTMRRRRGLTAPPN